MLIFGTLGDTVFSNLEFVFNFRFQFYFSFLHAAAQFRWCWSSGAGSMQIGGELAGPSHWSALSTWRALTFHARRVACRDVTAAMFNWGLVSRSPQTGARFVTQIKYAFVLSRFSLLLCCLSTVPAGLYQWNLDHFLLHVKYYLKWPSADSYVRYIRQHALPHILCIQPYRKQFFLIRDSLWIWYL